MNQALPSAEEAAKKAPASEEQRMRTLVTTWGRARWPGCRVLHELVLGERRIDLVFVCTNDLIGVEIKSSVDTLKRLPHQMTEYSRYLPEIWLAIAPRWKDKEDVKYNERNMLIVYSGDIQHVIEPRGAAKPYRDELVCSRLLELLWYAEACRIAVRTDVIPVRVPTKMRRPKVLKMLARLLTGNQIINEVCCELRARPFVGQNSDAATRQ